MQSQKALSNIDSSTYNDLKDNQKSSNLDFYYPNSIKYPMNKASQNSRKNYVDTKTYLEQIEQRYEQRNKKKHSSSSSSYSYDSQEEQQRQPSVEGRVTKISHNKVRESDVPSKFKKLDQSKLSQINFRADFNHPIIKPQDQSILSQQNYLYQQQQPQQFLIPQNLSLSRGPSEQQSNSPPKGQFQLPNTILDLHQKYAQSSHPQSIHPQSIHPQYQQQQNPSIVESRLTYQNQDMKARFFQLAVNMKNQYPSNHPVQNILIAQLYSECKNEQVPEINWPQWIGQKLSIKV